MTNRVSISFVLVAGLFLLLSGGRNTAADEPYHRTAEPQPSGWPLTPEERAYVLKPEHERRPGSEAQKYLPKLWSVVPSAGYWGSTAWLDAHSKLVEHVRDKAGVVDFLLVGDSITQQWGSPLDKKPMNDSWAKRFGKATVVNIGIGGDKTQNVLWRLDHGGVEGIKPKCIVLMIGINNMFFAPETGVESIALGVKACVDNLRRKFPDAPIIVVKMLPAHEPGNAFFENARKANAALDTLDLQSDRAVRILDLTADMTNGDGTIRQDLYTKDKVHLTEAGYAVYAEKLRLVSGQLLENVRN